MTCDIKKRRHFAKPRGKILTDEISNRIIVRASENTIEKTGEGFV
jgi:hypothetical protein